TRQSIQSHPQPVTHQLSSCVQRVPTSEGGSASHIGDSDVIKTVFDDAMRSPCPAGTSIRLRGGDGTVADVSGDCGTTTAVQTLGGITYQPAYVLVITIRGTPTLITPGSIPGLQLPATVVAQGGLTDDDAHP